MTDKADKATRNWDPSLVGKFLSRISVCQAEIDEKMDAAKDSCAEHKEDIKAIKKEASDEGIPRKELNKMIADAKRRAKEVSAYDKCNDDEKEVIDIMRDSAGFIPMAEVREQLTFNM